LELAQESAYVVLARRASRRLDEQRVVLQRRDVLDVARRQDDLVLACQGGLEPLELRGARSLLLALAQVLGK
jgi:hypothetical protein